MKKSAIIIPAVVAVLSLVSSCDTFPGEQDQVPVIVVTDLYVPAQDVGDNFDIIAPYALHGIDLKGVIFDVTDEYRFGIDNAGATREPGYIAVTQLNYLFGRNVPCACSPFTAMRSADDGMYDVPGFQQQGFELFFELLEKSEKPVDVVSTGSCRFLAVAYNRNPGLMKRKIRMLHICAGASSVSFKEWNIDLDETSATAILTSGLPISLYPCATENGPFDKGANNTFWSLDSLGFVMNMERSLRNYIVYSFLRKTDNSYLHYLDRPLPQADSSAFMDFRSDRFYGSGGAHYVWETSLWQQIADLALARRPGQEWRLVSRKDLTPEHEVFEEGMLPVTLDVRDDGCFSFEYSDKETGIAIYHRSDPELHQQALREALPALYMSFKTVSDN